MSKDNPRDHISATDELILNTHVIGNDLDHSSEAQKCELAMMSGNQMGHDQGIKKKEMILRNLLMILSYQQQHTNHEGVHKRPFSNNTMHDFDQAGTSRQSLLNVDKSGREVITKMVRPYNPTLNDSQKYLRLEKDRSSTERGDSPEIGVFDCRPFRGPKTPPTPKPTIESPSSQRLLRKVDSSLKQITQAELSIRHGRSAQRGRFRFNRGPQPQFQRSQERIMINHNSSKSYGQPPNAYRGRWQNRNHINQGRVRQIFCLSSRGNYSNRNNRDGIYSNRSQLGRFGQECTQNQKAHMNPRFQGGPKRLFNPPRFNRRRRIYSRYSGQSQHQRPFFRNQINKIDNIWSSGFTQRETRLQSVVTKCSSPYIIDQKHSYENGREHPRSRSESFQSQSSSVYKDVTSSDIDDVLEGCARSRIYTRQFLRRNYESLSPVHIRKQMTPKCTVEEEGEVLSGDESVDSERGRHVLETKSPQSKRYKAVHQESLLRQREIHLNMREDKIGHASVKQEWRISRNQSRNQNIQQKRKSLKKYGYDTHS